MEKPIIELRNIKHAAFASKETHCYSATIYVDGKKWGTVSNDGRGGCDNVNPITGGYQAVQDLNSRIANTYPKSEFVGDITMDMDLEVICSDLVNDFLMMKSFKKQMKRITYFKNGQKGLYDLPTKYAPTSERIAFLKAKAAWAKGVTFLQDLPENEAFAAFKKNA